ncbi:MAG: hypothetical protein H6983_01085 [Ectothiorhodospiraceae bacterium]|nr:hypothetical protein [Ectothiorhodospiraceae bacterium]
MKTSTILTVAAASLLSGAVHAACVAPSGFPPNDVALELPFAPASATAVEVDMNGVQRDVNDRREWATHGTLVASVQPDGSILFIASWTKNAYRTTEEYVCRMRYDGATGGFGDGMVHTVDHGTPTFPTPIEECKIDLVSNC